MRKKLMVLMLSFALTISSVAPAFAQENCDYEKMEKADLITDQIDEIEIEEASEEFDEGEIDVIQENVSEAEESDTIIDEENIYDLEKEIEEIEQDPEVSDEDIIAAIEEDSDFVDELVEDNEEDEQLDVPQFCSKSQYIKVEPDDEAIYSFDEDYYDEFDFVSEDGMVGNASINSDAGSHYDWSENHEDWTEEQKAMEDLFKNSLSAYPKDSKGNKLKKSDLYITKSNVAKSFNNMFYVLQTKNGSGEGLCTRASKTDLLHRRLWLVYHDDTWKKTNVDDMYWNTDAKINGITYTFENIKIQNHLKEIDTYAKFKKLICSYLDDHPEGMCMYFYNNGKSAHAICLTYHDSNGVIYCTDPVNVRDNSVGSINVDDSWLLSSSYGSNLEEAYNRIKKRNFDCVLKFINYDTASQRPRHLCSHTSYDVNGKCKGESRNNYKCSAVNYTLDEGSGFTPGIYKATSAVTELKKGPYSDANNCGQKILLGTRVNVEARYKNKWGNYFYYVKDYKGKSGYVSADRLIFVQSSVKLTHTDFPIPKNGSIVEKSAFTINGNINATGCKINKITTYFYSEDSRKTVNGRIEYSINDSKVDLSKTINKGLKFGSLSPGRYRYCVEVETNRPVGGSSTSLYKSDVFSVIAQNSSSVTVNAPTFPDVQSFTNYKEVTIKQNTSGADLYYSIDGGKNYTKTSKSSVIITVKDSVTVYAYSIKNGVKATNSIKIEIPKLEIPAISYEITSAGAVVVIKSQEGSTCYYRLGSGQYMKYVGAFTITSTQKVYAKCERKGYKTSSENALTVEVSEPKQPSITLDTKKNIAAGEAISVHWNKDLLASNYKVVIRKDNSLWKNVTTKNAQYTFVTDPIGIGEESLYEVSVTAENPIGTSDASNIINCYAHGQVPVRFLDYDGSVITELNVDYGYDAVKPVSPKRRGYTFSGWDSRLTGITSPIDITATYEINEYTVKFYDYYGVKCVGEATVEYGKSVDESMFVPPTNDVGRVFCGWNVFYAREDDSKLDLAHVDSDMKVRAVKRWSNENLPVAIGNVNVVANIVNGKFNGYDLEYNVSTSDTNVKRVKLIETMYAQSPSGAYQLMCTKVETQVFEKGSSNVTVNSSLIYSDEDEALGHGLKPHHVEIVAVECEGGDKTGGLLSETVSKDVSEVSGDIVLWSDWYTEDELVAAGHSPAESELEMKTQYRSRTSKKDVITQEKLTMPTTPAGYVIESNQSYWPTTWTSWSTTKPNTYSDRKIETKTEKNSSGYTEYRYGYWSNGSGNKHFCKETGKSLYGGTWSKGYTSWSKTKYSPDKSLTWGYCGNTSHDHFGYNQSKGSTDYWTHYSVGGKAAYWEESRYVDTSTTKTYYRYKDYVYKYVYAKWNVGSWQPWQDLAITATNTADTKIEVETRKLYRYKVYNSGDLIQNFGEEKTFEGSFGDSSYANKKALVIVYKSTNTDPTQSQIEYVGSTVLGELGEYNFKFIPKEEPTENTTGDFVVSMGVEGSNDLINVGIIQYPRSMHHVVFEVEGVAISEQEIEDGKNACAPEVPQKEGCDFVGWSTNFTNVSRDLTISAVYRPKSLCVAFVDYINRTTELRRFEYGSTISLGEDEDTPQAEGYKFVGWKGIGESITDDTVVVAEWKANEYRVTFYNMNGEEYDSQMVKYGESATLPAAPDATGMQFLGWSVDECWWNVTGNVNVYALGIFDNDTTAPTSNIQEESVGLGEQLMFSCEPDAKVYFTLDGSEPNIDNAIVYDAQSNTTENETEEYDDNDEAENNITYMYQEPIKLEGSSNVVAVAVADGKNVSEPYYTKYEYSSSICAYESDDETVELATNSVRVMGGDEVDVNVVLDSSSISDNIQGYKIIVDADPTVFDIKYVNDETPEVRAGSLAANNGRLWVDSYEDEIGWAINWVGDEAVYGPGELMNLKLVVSKENAYGIYPIKVSYIPELAYGGAYEQAFLERIVDVRVSKSNESKPIPTPTPTMPTTVPTTPTPIPTALPTLIPTTTPTPEPFPTPSVEETYIIKYVLNGGKNGDNPVEYECTSSTITLKPATRKGYRFAGWYTDSKFAKRIKKINEGSSGDITLYAKWNPNKYTIKYNANGGKGSMATLKNVSYGKSKKLSANQFTKKGYKFAGWATSKADAKKGKVKYKNKATVKNLTSSNGKTITLYAVWKKNKK